MSRLIYKRKGPAALCAMDLIERTTPGSATIVAEMGQLAGKVGEKEFHNIALQFAGGIQYVCDKYHLAPDHIEFNDHLHDEKDIPDDNTPLVLEEGDPEAYYDPETKIVRISRAWIHSEFQQPQQQHFADSLRDEYPIGLDQYAFLMGVEEAYHHKQRYGGSHAQRKGFMTADQKFDPADKETVLNDPMELEARKVVLAAARELGMIPKKKGR